MKKLKKGSKEAREYMAKIRAKRGKKGKRGKRRNPAIIPAVSRSTLKARKRSKRKVERHARELSKAAALNKLSTIRKAGRKIARSANINPFYFSGEDQLLMEGYGMKKARKHRAKRAKHSYFHGAPVSHKKRHRSRRRHSRRGLLMGGMGGGLVKQVTGILTQGAAGAAGAVGGAYLAKFVPEKIVPVKFKPAVPLLLAVALLTVGKKVPMAKELAFGAAMSGVLGFAKGFMPGLPTLAGVESAPELSGEEQELLLGAPQDYMGAVQSYAGEEGNLTPANL